MGYHFCTWLRLDVLSVFANALKRYKENSLRHTAGCLPPTTIMAGAERGIRTPEPDREQIYSLPCLTTSLSRHAIRTMTCDGASSRVRTEDLMLTKQLLYQLS